MDLKEISTFETCLDIKPVNKGMYTNVQICDDDNDDSLVIDRTGLVDIGCIQEYKPEGNRIVNISFFFEEMHRTFDNHTKLLECQFKDWHLINERRCGLLTQFFFKCQMCNYEDNFWSQPRDGKTLDINTAMTAATITTGIGYAQVQEMLAAVNTPCMSEKTYIKHREFLIDEFEKTAFENMKKAGEVEKQLAIERNETINGIPYITVVADGSWAKRSYGTAYDSLSGVGALIGYHTRKVLFVGIRNKFCTVCDMAERKNIEAKVHKCYKNFDRNASSTSMESDAIVEGFKNSIEMHGLIYRTVIADGDSNVLKSIIDNRPYQEQMTTVSKIECTNHLLRNLCKKLKVISETTEPKLRRNRCYIKYRNIVKKNIKNIRKEVLETAAMRRKNKQPQHCAATELQRDIVNIPCHVFGEHKRCNELGRTCKENGNINKVNYIPFLKLYGLYQKIESAIKHLAAYSDSLLLNLTNNPAELFNSVICKEIGGKRINFGARGSYNARVAGSVLQHNTQQVLTQLHESVCKTTVPSTIRNLEKQRQAKVARTREYRKRDGREKKSKKEIRTDRYYGQKSQRPDYAPHIFEEYKKQHLEKLAENAKSWKQIECDTKDQSNCELWKVTRNGMLTASNFGVVCRMRQTTSSAMTVKNILFPPFIDTAAMKYGRDMEEIAKQDLNLKLKKQIKPCGLFIDCDNPWLGATPDGLVDEDGLVEIKCPLSAENLSAEEAIETLPRLKSIFDKKNGNKMNKNHHYFYQVQGQLNITQRKYCIFALWTPKSVKTVRVDRDIDFWKNQMLPFLTRFYLECMLPEIVDSRHNRNMPIREPQYIIEAQTKSRTAASRNTKRKHTATSCINEQFLQENKILKYKVSTETATATTIAPAVSEEEDCIIVSHSIKENMTAKEIANRKKVLDHTIIDICNVKDNILSKYSKLNDESLDLFLRVVKETSCFETQSVQYIEYPDLIEASRNQSVQIIGGNCTDHWRCIFFDGTKLHVYDSIPGCTYDKMASKEKEYIRARFPQIIRADISFEKVQAQPDGTCCGIYAAAFATDVVLGKNPCKEKYSNDVEFMRRHFFVIIESRKLLPFPRQ